MRLVDLIRAELDDFLSQRKTQFATISADLAPLIDYSSDLLGSGKRFRALFCYWGWQAVSGLAGRF
ncbi:MAG: polyprenyl synthetase family protein, partial [Microbacteriaceae bacterium]